MSRGASNAGVRAGEVHMELYQERDPQYSVEPEPRRPAPYFCWFAISACCMVMLFEIRNNDWQFQPFGCSEQEPLCEPNPMFGPKYRVMQEMGAKNDVLIQEHGEWWRVLTCNWLHAGLIHLAMNMLAIVNLGFGLERMFGHLKIGGLYILSGLFGTMVSVIFLPGILSVGASASVFGLVGACWADVIVNFCTRCTLQGSGFCTLLLATVLNICIGLTPYVDNFMHVGGMVAGLLMGMVLFSQKFEDASGRKRYTKTQIGMALFAGVFVVGLATLAIVAGTSKEIQDYFRGCAFCEHINCVEFSFFTNKPWYSCDMAHVGCLKNLQGAGTCELTPNSTTVIANCLFESGSFERVCLRSSASCAFDDTAASNSALCKALCSDC